MRGKFQANVKSDFSEVRVFWVSSQAEPDVVQKLFAEHLFTITKYMYRISGEFSALYD